MTSTNDVRWAHDVLDGLFSGRILSRENEQLLRSFLPELPKQMTLEEITEHVRYAWIGTSGNGWAGNSHNREIALESWMGELYVQLNGLKDTPATVPALPEGIRLADHEQYGRVITSPKPDRDGVYDLLVPKPKVETGADWEYAHECELTFIDAEPAKSAHPEFLETEADYENAPEGTVVAYQGQYPWARLDDGMWTTAVMADMDEPVTSLRMGEVSRRVLRWGWGK